MLFLMQLKYIFLKNYYYYYFLTTKVSFLIITTKITCFILF